MEPRRERNVPGARTMQSGQPFKEDSSPKNNDVVLTYFFPFFVSHHFEDGRSADLSFTEIKKKNAQAMEYDIQ